MFLCLFCLFFSFAFLFLFSFKTIIKRNLLITDRQISSVFSEGNFGVVFFLGGGEVWFSGHLYLLCLKSYAWYWNLKWLVLCEIFTLSPLPNATIQNGKSGLPSSVLIGILFFLQDDIDVEVTVEIKSGESAFLNLSISSGKIFANFTLVIHYETVWLAAIQTFYSQVKHSFCCSTVHASYEFSVRV